MKVIMCLHHFLPQQVGGTEVYVSNLAKSLSATGAETIILIPGFDKEHTTEYIYEQLRVICYAERSIENRKMIAGKIKPEGLREFIRIIKAEQPDIVHFHELAPGRGINIDHAEAVKETGCKVIVTFHQSFHSCFKGSLFYKDKENCHGVIDIKRCSGCALEAKQLNRIVSKTLNTAGNILFKLNVNTTKLNSSIGTALGFPYVISKLQKDLERLSLLADKLIVLTEWYKQVLVKNNVPVQKIVLMKRSFGQTGGNENLHTTISLPLKVIYIGRITRVKGVHVLIDAVKSLDTDKIEVRIYGQETEELYTKQLRSETTGNPNIHWMGILPNQQVKEIMQANHLLCIPSYSEMSSLVLHEAIEAGIPVLASDCHGNKELITDGVNGWLFQNKNSKHLAEKLSMLLQDITILNKLNTHKHVAENQEEIAVRHLDLYESLAGKVVV